MSAYNESLLFVVCCTSIGLFGLVRGQLLGGTKLCTSLLWENQGWGSALHYDALASRGLGPKETYSPPYTNNVPCLYSFFVVIVLNLGKRLWC